LLENDTALFNRATLISLANKTALVGDYVVEAGDTFDSISAKLGTTASVLGIASPGLDPLDLGIGDVVIIPQGLSEAGMGLRLK
jgi:LysM repeat protein